MQTYQQYIVAFIVVLAIIAAGIIAAYYAYPSDLRQQTTAEKIEKINCPGAEIQLADVSVTNGTARVLVRNTGSVDNIQLISAVLYDTTGSAISTDSSLDTNFDKGKIDALTFNNQLIKCSTFSGVIVDTNCNGVSAIFSGKPKGC